MYSTINSYRNETRLQDLAALCELAEQRRILRLATRPAPTGPSRSARTLAGGRQVAMMMLAVLAVLVALAVPVVAAPLV